MVHIPSQAHLLIAVGRRPNTDDLGLDKAGVQTDDRGYIVVDDELRTNVEHIWAMGDCNGRGAFTHTSYNDFEIVAGNIGVLDGVHRRVSDRRGHHLRAVYRPPAGAGRYDGRRSAQIRPKSLGGQATDDTRRALSKGVK
jgi:pyruvate/2-oxoglutarate dehydrogenase complex dihydrolipoamide dehydrogenase (E3) component